MSTKTARAWHGRRNRPLSKEKKERNRTINTIIGAAFGALGFAVNPVAGVIGIIVGGLIGSNIDPDSK